MVATTDFGKSVKKRLVEMEKSQQWLICEIKKECPERYVDSGYLQKIMTGRAKSQPMVDMISKILGL